MGSIKQANAMKCSEMRRNLIEKFSDHCSLENESIEIKFQNNSTLR